MCPSLLLSFFPRRMWLWWTGRVWALMMFYGVRFPFSGEFLFTPSQLDNVQARVCMCGRHTVWAHLSFSQGQYSRQIMQHCSSLFLWEVWGVEISMIVLSIDVSWPNRTNLFINLFIYCNGTYCSLIYYARPLLTSSFNVCCHFYTAPGVKVNVFHFQQATIK